ncbi:HU family DNA-binding protein [Anaplasmataceae bacterium AB001_6]|nr:HU family DNA-binding protein [Anaplasmataceae bacterium AB001_6]
MSSKENTTIKKVDFVNKVYDILKENGSTVVRKNSILDIYDAMIHALDYYMVEACEKKKKNRLANLVVRFSKFGSFSIGIRPACEYSNPQTKAKVKKPQSYRIRFLASEVMKKKLNK